MSPRRAALALVALLACRQEPGTAPWLTMPTAASHARWFPIDPGSVHGVSSGGAPDCDACHFDRSTGQPSTTFRTFTCTHCHVEIRAAVFHDSAAELATFHAGVTEYGSTVAGFSASVASPANGGVGPQTAEDGACLHCHGDGTAGALPANHPFPVGDPPSHPRGACATCHTTATDRANPANFACGTCHLALDAALGTKHATPIIPVTDYATASPECLFCHGDALVYRAAQHPLATGTPLDGNPTHVTAGCTACHQVARLDRPFAASWGQHDCRPCHATADGPADHSLTFPLPHQDAAATVVAACADCHRDTVDRRKLGCAVCHPHDDAATATAHAAVPGFVAAAATSPEADILRASALCVRCHGDGAVPVTVAGHTARAGGFWVEAGVHRGSFGGGCLDCHPAALAAKPFAADFTRYTCGTNCHGVVALTEAGPHDDPVALGAFHAAAGVDFANPVASLGFDRACLGCHTADGAAPLGHPFPLGDPPDHPPGTCATCHTDLAAPEDPANFACGTCHLALDPALGTKHLTPAIPVTDYGATSPECLFCHGTDPLLFRAASHSVAPGTPLDGNPTHVAAGCTACHKAALTDRPFAADWGRQDCTPCHAAGGP